MDFKENYRIGGDSKVFATRKDGYVKLKFEDVVTADKHIKQDILKRFQFVNAIAKERELIRDFIIQALHLGYETAGDLMASIKPIAPKQVIDVDGLNAFLAEHGKTVDDFKVAGKAGERLNIE